MKLNDKEIRQAFIKRLQNRKPEPKRIIEELAVDSGNAIADIVTVSTDLHCFEIKGENDKIGRLERQSKSYDMAFRKVTLITTKNHLNKALILAPIHWGIIEAKIVGEKIKFVYHRKVSINPNFCKYTALQTLWKEEMIRIATKKSATPMKKNITREIISSTLAKHSTKKELSELIAEQLNIR
ncbi:sce7726 family protein [Shewanella oncorhynchi]|uniref:sce7726 family protein n=1 Tax=Shewanella oncorhynchi TaxID=2726434 RepID=UPI003D796ED0